MNQINDFIKKQPLVVALGALVVGVLFGLVVLGWYVWPVQWTDAAFKDLRAVDQQEYVKLVASAYQMDMDGTKAKQRIAALCGLEAKEICPAASAVISGTLTASAKDEEARYNLAALQLVVQTQSTGAGMGAGNETPAAEKPSLLKQLQLPLMACGAVIVLGVVGLGGYLFLRNRAGRPPAYKPVSPARQATLDAEAQRTDYSAPEVVAATPTGNAPIAQFMTTYVLGDDTYDDSFSVDGPEGSFLGECGMGISETIGVGDPKKVMAFEVWLFDKNDIRTVTRVLMSEHAFKDEALKSRLAAKGEPVMVQAGGVVTMETATLTVTARVVDTAYGGGALPPNSFFERLTIELAAFQK